MAVEYTLRRRRSTKSTIIKLLLASILIILLALEGISIYVVKNFDNPKKIAVDKNPADFGVKNYETVRFKSNKKDITLPGWILKSRKSKKTIILCHGYSDNRIYQYSAGKVVINCVEYAKFLMNLGYNVMLFDFRGHGDAAGSAPTTIGYNEQQDLIGAIKFVKKKGLGQQIGVIGFSMGAATALSTLNKTKDIDFVVADSPFSDLKDYLKNNMTGWTGLPKYPFTQLVLWNFELLDGVKYNEISPKNSVKHSKVPIMLIHGLKDTTIPKTESYIIKKNFKNPNSRLELFKNAIHIDSYYSEPNRYKKVVTQFIKDVNRYYKQ